MPWIFFPTFYSCSISHQGYSIPKQEPSVFSDMTLQLQKPSPTSDSVTPEFRADGPLDGVLATCRDSFHQEASDGLSLGPPGDGDGCLSDICHPGPARGTHICTTRKGVLSALWALGISSAKCCWSLEWSRLLASVPTQHWVLIWGAPPLTFKSCDHPLGWSAGQGVLQGIHTHFILGCYLEWTVIPHYEQDPAQGEILLPSGSVGWSHVSQSPLTETSK